MKLFSAVLLALLPFLAVCMPKKKGPPLLHFHGNINAAQTTVPCDSAALGNLIATLKGRRLCMWMSYQGLEGDLTAVHLVREDKTFFSQLCSNCTC